MEIVKFEKKTDEKDEPEEMTEADEVLTSRLGDYKNVVVIGISDDGSMSVSATDMEFFKAIGLMETAKSTILRNYIETALEE